MDNLVRHTLPKEERLCSRKALDELFAGGHRSLSAFPLRAVFMPTEEPGVRILVSVPKRHFKRAVKRNRIKRQVREAYRLQKELLGSIAGGLNIAFLWTSADLLPSDRVHQKMQNLLIRIHEALTHSEPTV